METNWNILSTIALAVLAASAAWSIYAAFGTDLPWRRWRVWLLLVLRLVVIAVLAAWCLDLRVQTCGRSNGLDLIVIADRSASISPQGLQTVEQWVSQLHDGMAGRPGSFEVIEAAGADGRSTQLAQSVELAMRKFTNHNTKRLVIVSDGRGTTGECMPLAREIAAGSVQLSCVDAQGLAGESLVEDLRVGPSLWKSVPTGVEVTLRSASAQSAKLTLLADVAVVEQKTIQLSAGSNVVEMKYTPAAQGLHRLEVQAQFTKDVCDWNNSAVAVVDVPLAPRVIIITDTVPAVAGLIKSLSAAGMQVRAVTPADLPAQFSADCLVLSNVSAEAMGAPRLKAVEQYVREGGSVVFCGGPHSFAAGGYVGSAIENVFPVMLTPRKEYPPFALAVVLDNSWSMNEGYTSSVGKIDIAKEIAIAAMEGLNRGDWLTLISFDSDYHNIIAPTKVDNLEPAKYEVSKIGAFGMTNVLGGLAEGAKTLQTIDASYKHIVLITDGNQTETGTDYSRFLAQIERDKVTMTAIGIGLSPNEKLLNTLAYAGKGRYYHAKTIKEVPSLVLQEAKGLEDQLIVNTPLPVKKASDDLALAGLEIEKMPPIDAYNRTRARAHAWTPLEIGRKNDPLLARMRYGRGQTMAFTSAAASSWVKDWIEKSPAEYATFWRQAVTSMLAAPYRPLEPKVRYDGGGPVFSFAGLQGAVQVQGFKLGAAAIAEAKADGLEVDAADRDAILVVTGEGTKQAFGWSRTYGKEFADQAAATEGMKAFCQSAGGTWSPKVEQVLAPAEMDIARQTGPTAWLVLAALALIAELLVRRLPAVTRLMKKKA